MPNYPLSFRTDAANYSIPAIRRLAADPRTPPEIGAALLAMAGQLESGAKPIAGGLGSAAADRLSRHVAVTSKQDPIHAVVERSERVHSLLEAEHGKKAKELDAYFPYGRLNRLDAGLFAKACATLSRELGGAAFAWAKAEKAAFDGAVAAYEKAEAKSGEARGAVSGDVAALHDAVQKFDLAYRRADYLVRAALADRPNEVASYILYPGRGGKKSKPGTGDANSPAPGGRP